MTARIDHGDTIVRNRTGTLPPPKGQHALAWTVATLLAIGFVAGLLCGLAVRL